MEKAASLFLEEKKMFDEYGRNIDYVRISLTDRCNLRCVYCMPEEGVQLLPHDDMLTFDEIVRLCRLFADLGIKKIKLTGGEPLCRLNASGLIKQIKELSGIEQVTLTTNGVELHKYWADLCAAGLDAINISLDTLDKELYHQITRRDKLDTVVENIVMAAESKQMPVKINCVPMRREQKLYDVASLAKDYDVHVRYIEMMPIGQGKDFEFYSREATVALLEKQYGKLIPCDEKLGNGPAEYYMIDGFRGKIGFISAVSHKFCHQCNRVRLTAEGFLKTCLQYDKGVELRSLLRSTASDDEIKQAIRMAIANKPFAHHFDEAATETDEQKTMSQIGG